MNRHLGTPVLLLVFFSGTAAAQTTRGFVDISAGLQSGSEGFSHSTTLESPVFGPEDGSLATRHPGGSDTLFDVAAGVRIVGQLGIGAGVSMFSRPEAVSWRASHRRARRFRAAVGDESQAAGRPARPPNATHEN